MKLPIIDLNALSQNDLVDAVRRACETNGFFILRNHSVRQATIREMRDASELFYALPVDVKMKAKQNANNRGYSPMMEEKLDLEANADSKEGYYIGRECEAWEEALPLRGKNVWLEEEGEDATEEEKEVGGRFRRAMEAYYDEMVELSESFVPIFAQALGLEKTFFDDKFKPHNALLRPLKYGKVKSEGKQFGCGAHSDYGVLTLLWVQPGSEGLEIFDEKSNGWMSVDLGGEERREDGRPDDFVCNIGDLMQYWTNDRFKSTVHRVVTDGTKERYSAAFFYEPNYETEIEPILLEGEEPKYEKMTFLKYILAKYDATHEAFDSREKSTNA